MTSLAGGINWAARRRSFFIFHCKVERLRPSRDAAPSGPPTTQPVSRSTPRMCSFSASASVVAAAVGLLACAAAGCNSPSGTCSDGPGDRITARSTMFCSSRMLPCQG